MFELTVCLEKLEEREEEKRKHVLCSYLDVLWKNSLFGRTFSFILSLLGNLLFCPLSTFGNNIQKKEICLILLMLSITFLFNALK